MHQETFVILSFTYHMLQVKSGCKFITEDIKLRIAFAFTNCFLEKTRHVTYQCLFDKELKTCTTTMTPEAYNAFLEFFTHTTNICYFLSAEIWQQRTDNMISLLSETAADVAHQTKKWSLLQNDILKKQIESTKNQVLLLMNGNALHHRLKQSLIDVHKMYQEFKDSTSEQKTIIFDIFDRYFIVLK